MQVSSKKTLDGRRRTWLHTIVPESKETTHIWPHKPNQEHPPMLKNLEDDAAIQGMNGIYITAIGSKKEINSDNVFYTPHIDGPYWWLPGASSW